MGGIASLSGYHGLMSRGRWFNMPRAIGPTIRYSQEFGAKQYWALADSEHRAGRMLGIVPSWRESRRRFPNPRTMEPNNPSPGRRPLALLVRAEHAAWVRSLG